MVETRAARSRLLVLLLVASSAQLHLTARIRRLEAQLPMTENANQRLNAAQLNLPQCMNVPELLMMHVEPVSLLGVLKLSVLILVRQLKTQKHALIRQRVELLQLSVQMLLRVAQRPVAPRTSAMVQPLHVLISKLEQLQLKENVIRTILSVVLELNQEKRLLKSHVLPMMAVPVPIRRLTLLMEKPRPTQ